MRKSDRFSDSSSLFGQWWWSYDNSADSRSGHVLQEAPRSAIML